MEERNYFKILNAVNVQDKVEQKNGLNYLSWAWAWGEVKKVFPDARYKIYERETEFGLVNYFTDGKTCWVKTGVIIDNLEHIEELPVMDFKNKAILLENITSVDVNKAIQRSITKACARHGLGLYIYAGEDLPEEEKNEKIKYKDLIVKYCNDNNIDVKEIIQTYKLSGKSTNDRFKEVYEELIKGV